MQAYSLIGLNNRAVAAGIPINGTFELTARCNLHCKFCYVYDRTANNTSIPEKTADEWLYILREAADEGMLTCVFTGGEPFIREDFEEIYCKAFDMGLRITIFTNATLVGKRQLAYLKKRIPDHVSISLYGASESSYQELCSYGDGYNRAMASIDALHSSGIPITFKAMALRPLLGEFECIGRVGAQYQCKTSIDMYLGPGRDDPQRLVNQWRIPVDKTAEVITAFNKGAKIYLKPLRQPSPISEQAQKSIPAIHCQSGKNSFFITYDGRMLGCSTLICFTTYPFISGFKNAWNGLKEKIQNAEVCEECKNCPDFFSCRQCPANRFQETGSVAHCNDYLKELAHSYSLLYQQEDSG